MYLKHFEWKSQYKLGFAVIDHQHQQFIQIMDNLYEAIRQRLDSSALIQVFDELELHAQSHFATEEKYFTQFAYEAADSHIADHHEFLSHLSEYRTKIGSGNYQVSFDLLDFLEDHLVTHLSGLDREYAACFREHGLT